MRDELLVKNEASAVLLAKNVGEHLHRKYPGHLWAVDVAGGVVTVHNLRLSGRWGFRVLESEIDPDYKIITRAGGEILERYFQPRGAVNPTTLNDVARDLRGEAVGETA